MSGPWGTTPRPIWPLAQTAANHGWDVRIRSVGAHRVQMHLHGIDTVLTATWAWSRTGWRLETATVTDRPDRPDATPVRAKLSDLRSIVERGPDV